MDDEPVLDLPQLVPARMVNEFVFCPRFFHLAWSSGETGENDLTVDGKWIHRSVDVERGRMGGPSESSSERVTSLTVSSERLGVITKIDTVISHDGVVTPIELKRGRPHDPDHPVWEPERIQLALQVLTLRDNGYPCEYGEVRFAEAKDRIRIDVDNVLESATPASWPVPAYRMSRIWCASGRPDRLAGSSRPRTRRVLSTSVSLAAAWVSMASGSL
jgi:CRISP-associated protein Cas1